MDISIEGCATGLRPVTRGLTASMRKWLNDPEKRKWRTHVVMTEFIKEFNLRPEDAGRLLVQWSRELWDDL